MCRQLKPILLSLLALLVFMPMAVQAADEEPIITIKTHRYDSYGSANAIQLSLGATVEAKQTKVRIDFGFGQKEYTVTSDVTLSTGQEDTEEEDVVVDQSYINGSVNSEGVIRIYGNASEIDYFNIHGSEVYEIDLSKMTKMSILELGHNEIHKLDLSHMPLLSYVDIKDNPFDEGLTFGTDHPYVEYICVNQIGEKALASGTIDLSGFSRLKIFTGWDAKCLKTLDVTNNPALRQLSVDNTGLKSIDVSKNEALQILNVSDCGFTSLDTSHNPYLVELYVANEGRAEKLNTLDVSNNTYLQRLFCQGNNLTTLDVSMLWNLISLYASNNRLSKIVGVDINEPEDKRPVELAYLDIHGNCFDFASLPDVDPMTYYDYDLQRPINTAKEYSVGQKAPLNLGGNILREGTNTEIAMAAVSRDGFSSATVLEEGADYEFDRETGIITFLKEQTDSVEVACYNDHFSGVILTTTSFLVRSEQDYGKPVEMFNLQPEAGNFSMTLTTRKNETLFVDFGDGQQTEVTTIANNPTVVSGEATGAIRVYGRVGASIATLRITDQRLNSIDLNKQTTLEQLTINRTPLKEIDLSWNHNLVSLDLYGNNLQTLDLTGDNNAFNKNVLAEVNVSNNALTSLDLGIAASTILNLNASHNKLQTVSLADMSRTLDIDLSYNNIDELDLRECAELRNLNLSNNLLTAIDITACVALQKLDLRNNKFSYATMPAPIDGMLVAPQSPLKIATKAFSVDLSSQADINGTKTVYTWRKSSTGVKLTEGVDYTITNGKTYFDSKTEGLTLYCELENALYPDFSGANVLRTTDITVTGMPQYCIGSFTTPVGGENALLSLASTEPDSFIYIDWGDGELREYNLQTMYTRFRNDYTIKDANVRIYSNIADHGNMYVFSVDSVTMQNLDVSKMTELYCLTVNNANLSTIDISKNLKLGEINFVGNHLETLDLSAHKNLYMVTLSHNDLTSIKLPQNNSIGWFAAAYNLLDDMDWSTLASAYNIDLAGNNLSAVDMSKLTGVGQLWLSQNNLHEIDLTDRNLYVLDISTNYFDMTTLPYPSIPVFFYGNQQPVEIECVDGAIDLSSQMSAWDVPSQVYFFEGSINITVDDEGNADLLNGEFYEGEDFFNTDGIIRFAKAHNAVTGLIVNELYPDLLLYTKTIAVTGNPDLDGISEVTASQSDDNRYNIAGQRVNSNAKGIIIHNGKKFLVK